jgi:hypothetical protein
VSNAKKPTGKPNSLARYRAEVKGGTPFVLWLDDDEKLEIARPTTDQMMAAEEAYNTGTAKDMIRAFCGDQADAFLAAVGDEDPHVTFAIVADMREHFGLGE